MIKLPVRCEQACANSIDIKDFTGKVICTIDEMERSELTHEQWENAKQIVRALNAGLVKQDKGEAKK